MKINSINTSHNQLSCGMALYPPQKKMVAAKIGLHAAEQFEVIRPMLETMAENNDIKIAIVKAKDFASRGFKITVSDVIKNPIKRMFGTYSKYSTHVRMGETLGEDTLPDLLLTRTANAKSRHNATKSFNV